ncbi:tudor domain-containing protein 10 isoform X5 [Bubalus bubalis]|uniref:tudor domain-containing protein 10 isoform X5 n=1 Tax=Bubalus bubalis TaxID=89462 RepID=UPI001E1B6954|nr:tudor domain-containing protein 10 isoform X5 [Bubalus bubalis]XP_025143539.3 tudor domain-containing protein 10 isoform X5 [Bubalus bubalis]XP_044800239.2 tudor domain-containing protein 10 isoform X5 [Bubalus bubalis]
MGVLPLPKELEVRRGYSLHCLCKHILGMCVGECLLKAGEEAVGTGPGAAAATVPGRTAGSAPRAPSSSRPTGAAAAVGDWLRTSGPARAPRASEEAELLEEEARRLGVWAAGWTHLARERSWSSSDFRTSAKVFGENGTLEEQKSPKFKKRETEVYVGNLPLDISEEEIRCLLKDFSPLHVHRVQNGCRCFAFVDLGSMQKVALAIQALNGKLFHKRKLYVNSNNRSPKRTPDVTERPQELLVNRRQWQPTPVLAPGKSHGWRSLISEKASAQGFAGTTACPQLTPKASGEPCETEKSKTSFFAVPMEMRHCSRTCRPCSAPWPRRRSSSPTCMTQRCGAGRAVWPNTTWAITARPGTGAGCWTAWTPGWWSCSWILADRPPSLCSPCAPWTVMTSGPSPR